MSKNQKKNAKFNFKNALTKRRNSKSQKQKQNPTTALTVISKSW